MTPDHDDPPHTFVGKVADFLRSHAHQWIDGRDLSRLGGCYAWRSRVSDCRRAPFNLRIENRQRRVRTDDGRTVIVSEYRYSPSAAGDHGPAPFELRSMRA
jgi:hypothetical protein